MTTEHNPAASTASEIGEALGVTPRTVRFWVEAGDLPKLERGTFDLAWATWLAAGRKVSTDWRQKPSAQVAVVAGWLQAHHGQLDDAALEALGSLFKRNGQSSADAMRSVGIASVNMGRA